MRELPQRPQPRAPPPTFDAPEAASASIPGALVPPPAIEYSAEADAEHCSTLAATLLRSLLSDSSEERLGARGQAVARASLIGRLASQQEEGSDFHRTVLDHVLVRCKDRITVLVTWLHAEFANGQGAPDEPSAGADSSDGRYTRILAMLHQGVVEALPPNDRTYTSFLLDVPHLPEALLLDALRADVASAARRQLGFATARDVALRRDGAASAVLTWLLRLCTFEGETSAGATPEGGSVDGVGAGASAEEASGGGVRADAIRVVASHLYASAHLAGTIEEQARAEMRRAIQQQGESQAEAAAQMQLHLALCAQRPALIPEWIGWYAEASPLAQSIMREQLVSVVPHVDVEALLPMLIEAISRAGTGGGAGEGGKAGSGEGDKAGDGEAGSGESGSPLPLVASLIDAILGAGSAPPPNLIDTVVAHSRSGGTCAVELLTPLLPALSTDQAEAVLPILLAAAPDLAKSALVKLMHAEPPPLAPPRLLLTLHLLPTGGAATPGGGPPLTMRQIIEAVATCISERSVFTMQVLASCLQIIAQHEPLPILSMRTMIEALVYWPDLSPFVMDILRHLIGRGIWKSPPLWTGFMKCTLRPEALPHSLPVILSLPKAQLLEVVGQQPNLREHLTSYAVTRLAEVPAEALEALGLADEEAEEL